MTAKLSKASKVRKLLHLPNAVIAERTGFAESYIRTVRQRTASDGSPQESIGAKKWASKNAERVREFRRDAFRRRYWANPEMRERNRARNRVWRARRAETSASMMQVAQVASA